MKKHLLIIFSVASALVLTGCGNSSSKSDMSGMTGMHHGAQDVTLPGTAAKGGGSYLDEAIPADVLAAPLFDQEGKSFTLGSLKGSYLVITNFLTSCQEICPMTTANSRTIGEAVASSPLKDKVKVLEISVDAERDLAPRLKAYFDMYESKAFSLASGSKATLAKVWTYFGAPATKMVLTSKDKASLPVDWQTGKPSEYDMSHPDVVIIVGPDSRWKWIDLGNPNAGQSSIPEKLKKFLSEDGLRNLAKPEEPTWSVGAVFSALKDLTGTTLA